MISLTFFVGIFSGCIVLLLFMVWFYIDPSWSIIEWPRTISQESKSRIILHFKQKNNFNLKKHSQITNMYALRLEIFSSYFTWTFSRSKIVPRWNLNPDLHFVFELWCFKVGYFQYSGNHKKFLVLGHFLTISSEKKYVLILSRSRRWIWYTVL